MHPSLRKNIAHGAGDGLKTLARADRRHFHDVVKDEVPLIERIVRSRELNRPAAVLLEELRRSSDPVDVAETDLFCFCAFIALFLSAFEFSVAADSHFLLLFSDRSRRLPCS